MFRIEPIATNTARFLSDGDLLRFVEAINSDGDWPYLLQRVKDCILYHLIPANTSVRQLAAGMVLPSNVLRILKFYTQRTNIVIGLDTISKFICKDRLSKEERRLASLYAWRILIYGLAYEKDSWFDENYQELLNARLK